MKVLQLPLETLEIAEGEAKTRYLASVVSRVELYLSGFLTVVEDLDAVDPVAGDGAAVVAETERLFAILAK